MHCGFCTATCPTYLLLGDELDSPRGRIYLIKDMLEGGKPATPEVVKHIDRCLSCLSCMTTCPSGVHYMHLVDHARAYIEETYRRPWHDRLAARAPRRGAALSRPLPRSRSPAALLAQAASRRSLGVAAARRPRGSRAMLELAPAAPAGPLALRRAAALSPPQGARRGRVALLSGCAQPVLEPGFNEAAIRLLNRHGVEVVLPKGEGCCGALVHHMGREHEAHALRRGATSTPGSPRWTATASTPS